LNYYRAAGLRSTMPQDSALSQPMMIDVTTLVIWGEKDTALLTGNLDGMERYVKKLRIERIPDGSHWVIHEKPDLVIRYMREFLQQ
jgi:pimeloyl-ACP methyl ester carboxylesterase